MVNCFLIKWSTRNQAKFDAFVCVFARPFCGAMSIVSVSAVVADEWPYNALFIDNVQILMLNYVYHCNIMPRKWNIDNLHCNTWLKQVIHKWYKCPAVFHAIQVSNNLSASSNAISSNFLAFVANPCISK